MDRLFAAPLAVAYDGLSDAALASLTQRLAAGGVTLAVSRSPPGTKRLTGTMTPPRQVYGARMERDDHGESE